MAHATRDAPELTPILDRNIRALLERRRGAERAKRWRERLADEITHFTGSMRFVYIHLALFGGWIARTGCRRWRTSAPTSTCR